MICNDVPRCNIAGRIHNREGLSMRQLKVIAVAQRKGGPGKTTLSRMLLETYGVYLNSIPPFADGKNGVWRAAGIDFDGQCNLSQLLLPSMDCTIEGVIRPPVHPEFNANNPDDEQNPPGLKDYGGRSSSALMFSATAPMPYRVSSLPGVDTIDIFPGDNRQLRWLEEQEHTKLEKDIVEAGRRFIKANEAEMNSMWDLVVIDTAPANSPLTRAALRMATHLVIPMELEQQCIDGLHEMLGMWRTENKRRSEAERLEILLIQPNRVKMKRAVHQEFLAFLKKHPTTKGYLAKNHIPDLAEFAERDVHGAVPRSVFQLGQANKARQIAVKFATEVHERLFGKDATPAPKYFESEEAEEGENVEVA